MSITTSPDNDAKIADSVACVLRGYIVFRWTPDGCYCASAGEEAAVRLYSVRGIGVSALAEVKLCIEVSPFNCMHCLAFAGDHLIAGGEEGSIEIWRLERHDRSVKVCLISLADEAEGG